MHFTYVSSFSNVSNERRFFLATLKTFQVFKIGDKTTEKTPTLEMLCDVQNDTFLD